VSLNALILAGSRGPADPVAASAGLSHKALVPVGGKAMLARVIDCLEAVPGIERIAVAIENPERMARDPALAPYAGRVIFLEAAGSPSLSVAKALEGRDSPFPLLVTTADHPLLTPAMVRYFLAHQPAGCSASAGLAGAATIRAAYPDTRRTYLRFRDGGFSGCNLFLLQDEGALAAIGFWRRIEADRKRPWRMARQLGPVALLSFLTRRLTIGRALELLGDRVGARLGHVDMPFAEAAIDVDKPDDLSLAEAILLRRHGKREAG
jgi:GTP:adenosylcobinamide-phosphate guanylyltransferase